MLQDFQRSFDNTEKYYLESLLPELTTEILLFNISVSGKTRPEYIIIVNYPKA